MNVASSHVVHRVAATLIPKVGWTFYEIPKMSPGGARTHDPAATLSKLQPNLGIQVTATRCTTLIQRGQMLVSLQQTQP